VAPDVRLTVVAQALSWKKSEAMTTGSTNSTGSRRCTTRNGPPQTLLSHHEGTVTACEKMPRSWKGRPRKRRNGGDINAK
jgi:hypothetical protein